MKKLSYLIFFLSTLCAVPCHADTWTSVKGEKLTGRFVRYNLTTDIISIQRAYDGRIFGIPEAQLILSDRLKAIRLEYKDTANYWYTDFQKAKAENPNSRCLFLYRNNADADTFELFYTKLLLRDDFRKLLQHKRMIACVQISGDMPEELEYNKISEYFTHSRHKLGNETEWRYEKTSEDPKIPLVIYVDFRGNPVPRIKKYGGMHWGKHWYPLYASTGDSNPFQHPFVPGKFIRLEEIEEHVVNFKGH